MFAGVISKSMVSSAQRALITLHNFCSSQCILLQRRRHHTSFQLYQPRSVLSLQLMKNKHVHGRHVWVVFYILWMSAGYMKLMLMIQLFMHYYPSITLQALYVNRGMRVYWSL